jgi:ketosteroid isomerase-like protein
MSSEIGKQTEAILLHHLTAIGAGDVDDILTDYDEGSVLFTPDGLLRGPAQIRPLFKKFIADLLLHGSNFEMLRQEIAGGIAYIVWKADSVGYDFAIGTDTFVIRDEKISIQTFAAHITPKNM